MNVHLCRGFFFFFFQKILDVWRLPTQICPTFNRLQLVWDQTHLDYSPELLTNKGNSALHYPSLKSCTGERKRGGKNSSYLTNPGLFEVRTRKNEGAFFSGPELHMTAIWGYCVFWPKRVVYDRWQERKSRAAGFSTDMQIAFSWLPYSARYLSSGLQYASSFTARKQLINSTEGRRKESWCWVEGENSPKWPEN